MRALHERRLGVQEPIESEMAQFVTARGEAQDPSWRRRGGRRPDRLDPAPIPPQLRAQCHQPLRGVTTPARGCDPDRAPRPPRWPRSSGCARPRDPPANPTTGAASGPARSGGTWTGHHAARQATRVGGHGPGVPAVKTMIARRSVAAQAIKTRLRSRSRRRRSRRTPGPMGAEIPEAAVRRTRRTADRRCAGPRPLDERCQRRALVENSGG
jgi:hypothetical protein